MPTTGYPIIELNGRNSNERTGIVIRLPMTTATYYILSHQPKIFDWRASNARPHPLKKVQEGAYARDCETLHQIIAIGS